MTFLRRFFTRLPAFALLASLALLPLRAEAEPVLDSLQLGTGQGLRIVYLHGDEGNGGDPMAYAGFMAEIARRLPDASVHYVLRPGYRDPWGRQSPGENFGRRDQYTAQAADLIAAHLGALPGSGPVLAMGHSGGAAQLALALARHPGLVDAALLVACPCDLDLWRNLNPDWPEGTLTRSVSAMDLAPDPATPITLIVGAEDAITPPALSESFAAHLARHGVPHHLQVVPGGDHGGNRALSTVWIETVLQAAERLRP